MDDYDENRDRRRRRRNPFDIFGFDDDFIRDIFEDERVMEDIKRMTEEMMKMFSNAQPGKPVVHGFKINIGLMVDQRLRILETCLENQNVGSL